MYRIKEPVHIINFYIRRNSLVFQFIQFQYISNQIREFYCSVFDGFCIFSPPVFCNLFRLLTCQQPLPAYEITIFFPSFAGTQITNINDSIVHPSLYLPFCTYLDTFRYFVLYTSIACILFAICFGNVNFYLNLHLVHSPSFETATASIQ